MTKEKVNELCESYSKNPTDKGFMQIVKELEPIKGYFLKYFKIKNFKNLEKAEFEQIFQIGVFEGIRRYNPEKGNYFSSIFCYVRDEIQKFLYGFLVGSKRKYERREVLMSELSTLTNLILQRTDKTPEKAYLEKEFLTCLGQFAETAIGEKEAVIQYIQGDIQGARKVKKSKKSLTKMINEFFTECSDALKNIVFGN